MLWLLVLYLNMLLEFFEIPIEMMFLDEFELSIKLVENKNVTEQVYSGF